MERVAMWTKYWSVRGLGVAVISLASVVPIVQAQERVEVTIADTMVMPENLTSSQDGTVFFGSMAKGTIYRAAPGAAQAEPWIEVSTSGLTNVLGVLADDEASTLWVCANPPFRRDGPPTGEPALEAFDLNTGAAKGTYRFPNGGLCNDIAVAADGTAYASDTFGGRVLRLTRGATALDVWAADPQLEMIDGLTLLADGALYVNTYSTGKLLRIPVGPDGAAGPIVQLETSLPLDRPDGLRAVGPETMLQAEGQGRLAEITIDGDRAEVRVLMDGLTDATGVTLVGKTALVLVERLKAAVVPYPAMPDLGNAQRTPASQGAPASTAVANPTYVSIQLEVDVNRPAAEVWQRVGKFCDIAEWLPFPIECAIVSGVDGEVGAVRSVANEVLVGKTELSYTYTMPVREGRPYDLYHGTLEARVITPSTSRLIYTIMYDNSMLADDAARAQDRERRTAMFTQALENMKILAEGGTLSRP